MTLLVFGKSGQVATELARRVPEAVFLGRDRVDLSVPDRMGEAIRALMPSGVINAAAYTAVDRTEEEEALATVVNGAAPGVMARTCADLGIPFVHLSTDYVFDGTGSTPWTGDAPTAPIGAYGRSKLAGEEAVRGAGGIHVILRTSWVFSAHGTNFVKTMLRVGAERDVLRVVSDQVGGPTPAADISRTCLQVLDLLRKNNEKSGTYHYSGAPDVSWADFASAIFDLAGMETRVEEIPTSKYPTPAARPLNSRLDCAQLQAVFGIKRPDWKAGLADVLKELRA
ncbi:dTDP-4-dehydrorhamnose reductase [Aliiroseovarius subalbicans]|uniref:dTDP-4-dehydrorhamnose reductase n=1 Tax=Aliiroseovarius subalbicans TaxID=2925840 RepID=UPI001F59BB83|nr:dTDP-4-dehydrorhamnose reductase [Aliiroseovarius subalbicans]MCI2401164.1 dTDP-4-dehydrorhamnose reductase [Aliiroseovarius subalbicans]